MRERHSLTESVWTTVCMVQKETRSAPKSECALCKGEREREIEEESVCLATRRAGEREREPHYELHCRSTRGVHPHCEGKVRLARCDPMMQSSLPTELKLEPDPYQFSFYQQTGGFFSFLEMSSHFPVIAHLGAIENTQSVH